VKDLHIRHNLFAGTEILSLSVHEPIAIRVLWGVHDLGEGLARVRCGTPVKVSILGAICLLRANRHMRFVGDRPPPHLGRGLS
jgi:hypothetical protein